MATVVFLTMGPTMIMMTTTQRQPLLSNHCDVPRRSKRTDNDDNDDSFLALKISLLQTSPSLCNHALVQCIPPHGSNG
jgi:hypothetical protein